MSTKQAKRRPIHTWCREANATIPELSWYVKGGAIRGYLKDATGEDTIEVYPPWGVDNASDEWRGRNLGRAAGSPWPAAPTLVALISLLATRISLAKAVASAAWAKVGATYYAGTRRMDRPVTP